MSVVHLENLKENMTLSEEVKDVKGRLLLSKGQKVEASHIRILKMWGVTEVNIVGEVSGNDNYESSIDSELIERIKKDTKQRFKFVDLKHPAISELFRLAVYFRSKNGISEKEILTAHSETSKLTAPVKPDVMKKILHKQLKLPEVPYLVFELKDIMSNPRSSANDIAQIVSKSPSLTMILLRIVNSSFYAFPSKIDSISRAVTIIGTREIGNLSLGISIINIFDGIPEDLIDMHAFLKHGFACGIISRILAAQKDIPQTEQLFVSGLLHDIGRAVIYKYFPEHASVLLHSSSTSGKFLYTEEKKYLGCRHTDLGKYLLKKWNLPFSLENNVFCHHNPSNAKDPVHATIVHLADVMANALELGSSGERFVPPLDYNAFMNIGLPPSCFEVVIRQAIDQLSAFDNFLENKNTFVEESKSNDSDY